ncbi:MAG: hypothetical protein V9G19_14580 [Tetrasphaera sp.]
MTALAAPVAKRLRKPSWKDARLLIGLLLVLLSTSLGAAALRAADDRVPVFVARQTLVPGQRLDPGTLGTVAVQVDRTGEAYLRAAQSLPPDGYVLREVRSGELLPASAVGTAAQIAVQPLAVGIDQVSAATLVDGSVVDVYANKRLASSGPQEFGDPVRVLEAVSVATVSTSGSGLGSSGRSFVQLLVPTGRVAQLIGLIDAGAKVTLVAVPGSLRASGS